MTSSYWPSDYRNVLTLDYYPSSSGHPLLPEEAWNIDTKVDDGVPGYGMIMTWAVQGGTSCVSTSTQSSAVYSVAVTTKVCILLMKMGV